MSTRDSALSAAYAEWKDHRAALSEQEERGPTPAPGAWAGSDDTAVELLERCAALLCLGTDEQARTGLALRVHDSDGSVTVSYNDTALVHVVIPAAGDGSDDYYTAGEGGMAVGPDEFMVAVWTDGTEGRGGSYTRIHQAPLATGDWIGA